MTKRIRLLFELVLVLLVTGKMKAQLSGVFTVPGTYSSIGAAIVDLNAQGVNGTVTINVSAGHTETVPAGGYSLTATGTLTSPIIFQKNGAGANPLITAYTGGIATPSSALQDGIWRLIGSDYVTIDGIDLVDPNTTNPSTMEFGYGLFKASSSNGCNNNTIKNCVITLNRINVANGSVTALPGSRGIDVVNATSSAHTTSLTITSVSGSNSDNKFYSNTIQNCNNGIAIIGFVAVSPFTNADQNNDIGGLSAITGNTIINYGGGTLTNNPAAGIRTLAQYNLNVSFNLINSNNGSGINHSFDLYGIQTQSATSANLSISNNTVSIQGTSILGNNKNYGINNESGSTPASNSINISNNLITNCSYTAALTATIIGIYNTGSSSTLIISNNTFTNSSSSATAGGYINIYNSANCTNININNNLTGGINLTSALSGNSFNNIVNFTRSSVNVSLSSNTVQAITLAPISFYQIKFIVNTYTFSSYSGPTPSVNINANRFNNINISTNSNVSFISNLMFHYYYQVSLNSINGFTNTGNGSVYGIDEDINCNNSLSSLTGNNFSNITLTGTGNFIGINMIRNITNSSVTVNSNTVTNITLGNGDITGISVKSHSNTVQNNFTSNFYGAGNISGIDVGIFSSGKMSSSVNSIFSFTSIGAKAVSGFSSTSGSFCSDLVFNNKVYDLVGTHISSTVTGLSSLVGNTMTIHHNLIGDLKAPNAINSSAIVGLNVSGNPNTVNYWSILYNTIRLAAVSTGSIFGSYALKCSSGNGFTLKNNILINTSGAAGTGSTVAFGYADYTLATYSTNSNNNIFYAGTPSPNNLLFSFLNLSLLTYSNYPTLTSFTTAVSPRESASNTENTNFLSTSGILSNFLHVAPPSLAESNGVNTLGYTNDFDGDIRQGNIGYIGNGFAPDVGADEFGTPNCSTLTAVNIFTPTSYSICASQSVALSRSGYTFIPGIQQQWQISNTPGGPYTVIPSATGITYNTPTLTPGNYYYVVANTCSFTNQTAISNEATVSVYPYPVVSVSPITSTICAGGTPTILTASGANSYTWTPNIGLSSANGPSVSASPTFTTLYTVTGSNPGGCTGIANTATAIVNVIPAAGGITVTATPTLICQGSSANLQATSTSSVYAVTPISFSPVPTPTSGVGTLCSNGNAITGQTSGNLDDGDWYVVTIPFNFVFFAATYTGCAISTNGFMTLSSLVPPTFNGYGLAFPNFNAGRPSIGAVYGNLSFANTGTINVFTTGSAPNRRFVVNWLNGRYELSNTGTVTTQIILYETTNIIEVHTTRNTAQYAAVEGIQNSNGSVAYVVPGRNNSIFNLTNDAYRWSPAVTYSWIPSTYLSSPTVSNPIASNIQNSITYTALAQAANGCVLRASATISVIPSPTLSVNASTTSICSGNQVNLTASGANTYTWSTGAFTPTVSLSPIITTTYNVSGTGTLNNCVSTVSQVITVIPLPTLSISGNSGICVGQNASLTVTGANTYSWSNGAGSPGITTMPLTNTVYSVTGTSSVGGCIGTTAITVTVFPNPTITVSGSSVICSGQNASLIATGANTYSWSDGSNTQSIYPSPQVTTIYSVTGTNTLGGCTSNGIQTLSVNPSPTISISGGTVICAGQSATLSATGANTYTWSNAAIGSSISVTPPITTTFSVTGTNTLNACESTTSEIITVFPIPVVNISGTTAICLGQTANFLASGASNYSWSNGSNLQGISVSPLVNTSYSVIGTSGPGCSVSAAATLTVHSLPTATISASPSATLCQGETVQLDASGAGTNFYTWSEGSTGNNILVSPLSSATYSLHVVNSITGCVTNLFYNLTVDPCTNLSEELNQGHISIYPNPFNSQFYIENEIKEQTSYEIFDMSGRVICFGKINQGRNCINMNGFAKGVYYVKITGRDSTFNFKILAVD